MCRLKLYSLRFRLAYKVNRLNRVKESRLLRKIFKELVFRQDSEASALSKEVFLKILTLPGLLGRQLFHAVDLNTEGKVDVTGFVHIFQVLYRGDFKALSDLLFRIFDFRKAAYLTQSDIEAIFQCFPNKCCRCQYTFVLTRPVNLNQAFEGRQRVEFSEFSSFLQMHQDIGSAVLAALFAGIPDCIDEVFASPARDHVFASLLEYKGQTCKVELRAESLYVSTETGLHSIIPLPGLFLEEQGASEFAVFTASAKYWFSTQNQKLKESWVEYLGALLKQEPIQNSYVLLNTIAKSERTLTKHAIRRTTGDHVVVKQVTKRPAEKYSEEALFVELYVLRHCNHANLVTLQDLFETPEHLFLVFEEATHGSLLEWLDELQSQIDEQTAKQIVKDLARGLSYLHARGVLHRDLRPENVLLFETSAGLQARLSGFSQACLVGPGQVAEHFYGVLPYSAPEVLEQSLCCELADAWSLGVIIHKLLVGELPVLNEQFDTQGPQWIRLSSESKQVVTGLLQKSLQYRMTVAELLVHDWLSDTAEAVSIDLPWVIAKPSILAR